MFEAFVGNVGTIGHFPNKTQAIKAVREDIKSFGRAEKAGYVLDPDGELVWETFRVSPEDKDERIYAALHAAVEYLEKDRKLHGSKWILDSGKLLTALENSGLKVTK